MNKIKNWFTWKRRWKIYGYMHMGMAILFYVTHNFPMAYTALVAVFACFGIAECKKEE